MKLNALKEELGGLRQNIATMKQDLNTTKVWRLCGVMQVCICVVVCLCDASVYLCGVSV